MVQVPDEHSLPEPQVVEQVPQAVRSVWRFLQTPEQALCPVGQAQAPDWQVLPPEQVVLQVPQLLELALVFTHTPEQVAGR